MGMRMDVGMDTSNLLNVRYENGLYICTKKEVI